MTIDEDSGLAAGPGGDGIEVCVYRSARHVDTYAYVPARVEFEDLPAPFREQFGPASSFLNFWLHPQKTLAQADPAVVIAAIAEQGFYLQLPPPATPSRTP